MSRLGLSYDEFLQLTPLQLHYALKEKTEFYVSDKQLLHLVRYLGVVLRNKGLKMNHQIRDPKKFYKFWFEHNVQVHIPTNKEWKALDKKYIRATNN